MICTPHPILFGLNREKMECAGHVARIGEEERRIEDFGGEISVKDTTWETQT